MKISSAHFGQGRTAASAHPIDLPIGPPVGEPCLSRWYTST